MQPFVLRARINFIADELKLDDIINKLDISYFDRNKNLSIDEKKDLLNSILDFHSMIGTLKNDDDNRSILHSVGFDANFGTPNLTNLNLLIATSGDVNNARTQNDYVDLVRLYRNCYALKSARNLVNSKIHGDLSDEQLKSFEDKLPLLVLEKDQRGVTVKDFAVVLKELDYLLSNVCRLDSNFTSSDHYISIVESGSDILLIIIGVAVAVRAIRKVFDDVGAIINSIGQIRIGQANLTAQQLENAYSSLQLLERLRTEDTFKEGVAKLNDEDKQRIYKSVINLAMKGVGTYGSDSKLLHGMRGLLASSSEEPNSAEPIMT